jgi:hypothetical protein
MSTTIHNAFRPLSVNFAIIVLLVVPGSSLVRFAVRADWGNPLVCIQFACQSAMLWIPLWFIFRGSNWARWIMLTWVLGGLCVGWPRLAENFRVASGWSIVTYYWRSLAEVAALVALFFHSSNKWFRGHTYAQGG